MCNVSDLGTELMMAAKIHETQGRLAFNDLFFSLQMLNQLVEGAETLARAQVRALFEGNDEYAEIVTSANQGSNLGSAIDSGVSDMGDEGEDKFMSSLTQFGCGVDPRPFKCIACKVAFRFQV